MAEREKNARQNRYVQISYGFKHIYLYEHDIISVHFNFGFFSTLVAVLIAHCNSLSLSWRKYICEHDEKEKKNGKIDDCHHHWHVNSIHSLTKYKLTIDYATFHPFAHTQTHQHMIPFNIAASRNENHSNGNHFLYAYSKHFATFESWNGTFCSELKKK